MKKFLSIVLALIATFSLVACSNKPENGGTVGNGGNTEGEGPDYVVTKPITGGGSYGGNYN